jgi:electron transfer flavoprotein alpha subunit
MSALLGRPAGHAVAVIVVHEGRLPAGAAEAAAEAGGQAVVVGSGAAEAASSLGGATEVWTLDLEAGPRVMAERLTGPLEEVPLIVLPASPEGRDLAPRLAASMGRPLLAEAVRVGVEVGGEVQAADRAERIEACVVRAELLRAGGQVVVPVECPGRAVATLGVGVRAVPSTPDAVIVTPLRPAGTEQPATNDERPRDPEVLALIEPDPATMDLADATRVLGGGAGLVPRDATDQQARALFTLLAAVAARLGASMGATRVATDAGWTAPERQIGTTGVAIDPDLYVAFGVSGAAQHTSGLGAPTHVVSVNVDPSCPMTAMADLGLVTDATTLLLQLAEQLDVAVPPELDELSRIARSEPRYG